MNESPHYTLIGTWLVRPRNKYDSDGVICVPRLAHLPIIASMATIPCSELAGGHVMQTQMAEGENPWHWIALLPLLALLQGTPSDLRVHL